MRDYPPNQPDARPRPTSLPAFGASYGYGVPNMVGAPAGASRPLGRLARILFLHPSDELYGPDQVLLNIVRGLDRRQFEPYVIVGNDLNYGGMLSRELSQSGIPHHSTTLGVARRRYFTPTGLLDFWKRVRESAREIGQFVRDEYVDVIYSNTLSVWTGALVAQQTDRPHVWHIHEQIEHPRVLRDYTRRFVPKHADRIIGASAAALETLGTSREARQKGNIIYNGLRIEEWANAPGREAVRAELGIGPQDLVFGMVARLTASKAPDRFVEVAARLVSRYPHVHFVLAGGPVPGQTAMVRRLERLRLATVDPGRIHLLGYRRDVQALMSAVDVLVQPSRRTEACSLAILQAMCAGRAVVATAVGGNPELVIHDETGLLTPPDDLDALTDAVEVLVLQRHLIPAYGYAGQMRAQDYFTLDQQIAQTNEVLYEETIRAWTAAQ